MPAGSPTWQGSQKAAGAPARPFTADPDDPAVILAARRELEVDTERILIENFLERTGPAIDTRVDERIALHRAATG